MASIKDVARQAGVGVGTVSRMINDSGYVSEATKAKIEQAMKELDYTPNELARNLYRKRSGIIAVLVPNVSNPFFAEFIDCVEEELHKVGFKTMLCNTVKGVNAEEEYLDMLNRHIVDGVISGVSSLDKKAYTKIQKPIVALDRYLGEEIPVVAVDHKEGGRIAAETLIENGCKRVLHFRSVTGVDTLYHDRHAEFEKVMRQHGAETFCYDLAWDRLDTEYYHEIVEKVFEDGVEFDGVFGVDRLAIECMNELIHRHKKIPRDVKIVSYDGTYITELVEPKMTTIVQPIAGLAKESVSLLCELINGNRYVDKRVILKIKLRKGGTTL
ncbi:MAG: LacI family DNA-binding transcriptional regulator [Clostridiales bacterium]|nr:LacI family DNA-binding transcriptional regulator [Clostridiales bacterium]